jgi:hypothetical protein
MPNECLFGNGGPVFNLSWIHTVDTGTNPHKNIASIVGIDLKLGQNNRVLRGKIFATWLQTMNLWSPYNFYKIRPNDNFSYFEVRK